MPLLGAHEHTVGPNGRIIIPAKLRVDLGDDFVAVAVLDCLQLFPMSRWLEIEDRLRGENPFSEYTTDLLEYIGRNSALCSQDKQGRTTVPVGLLEEVGIKDNIVSVGAVDRIRVRSKERYQTQPRRGDADMRALIERVLK